jgi:hypothetical protein
MMMMQQSVECELAGEAKVLAENVLQCSAKRFVSLHFLNPKTAGRTPWTGDQPVARPLPTQDNTNRE